MEAKKKLYNFTFSQWNKQISLKGNLQRVRKWSFSTWICIVLLSNALNSSGSTSVLISSRGVFSKITCRYSSSVTVACIDFGELNIILQKEVMEGECNGMFCFARYLVEWKWTVARKYFLILNFIINPQKFEPNISVTVPVNPNIVSYLKAGSITVMYSAGVDSWTKAKAGWSTAAKTSAVRISCCRLAQTCCHHNFWGKIVYERLI